MRVRAVSAGIAAFAILACGCELLSLAYLQDGKDGRSDATIDQDSGSDAKTTHDSGHDATTTHDSGSDAKTAHDSGRDGGVSDANDHDVWPFLVYYHFNGNTDDVSGHDAAGTLTGNASVDAAAGVNGKALSCVTAGDGMTFSPNAFVPDTTVSFTIAFWFQLAPIPEAGQPNQTFFDKGGEWNNSTDTNAGVGIGYWEVNSYLQSFVNDTQQHWTGVNGFKPSNFASDGKFHHVAMVVDRTLNTLTEYVDGNAYSTAVSLLADAAPLGSFASTQSGRLCGEQDGDSGVPSQYVGSYQLNGAIDEFMIVGKMLGPGDIGGLYNLYGPQ